MEYRIIQRGDYPEFLVQYKNWRGKWRDAYEWRYGYSGDRYRYYPEFKLFTEAKHWVDTMMETEKKERTLWRQVWP